MNRRDFIVASSAVSLAPAAPTKALTPVTVLYGERVVPVEKARLEGNDLWVRSADLPAVNEFHLKPQGACRADTCIPITKEMKNGQWFNLTAFAHRIHQPVVADSGVWSFGEIPVLRGDYYQSRIAPDFAVPDRKGKVIHLSDFKGKKRLVITWASW
jgi:hypothetical protein